MTVESLAKLVETMRTIQKEYFANRTQTNLRNAKLLEKEVDTHIKDILHGNQSQRNLGF